MQNKLTSLFLALNLCICTQVSAQQSDSTILVQLLKDDYATMSTRDISAHLRNVTSDYHLIERGEIWNLEKELDEIYRSVSDTSLIRTDFFTIKTVKIVGDMAYAIWHLRSEFKKDGKLVTERLWNESGVFRRETGHWRIALIHSSLEPKK